VPSGTGGASAAGPSSAGAAGPPRSEVEGGPGDSSWPARNEAIHPGAALPSAPDGTSLMDGVDDEGRPSPSTGEDAGLVGGDGDDVGGHGAVGQDAGGVPAVPGAAARAAIDPSKDIDGAVLVYIQSLMAVSRHTLNDAGSGPGHKRRRLAAGGATACTAPEYTYTTVATAVQALYEDEGDWQRTAPLTTRRKGWRAGSFDSFRLRAVQRFALDCGGGGLSLEGIEKLWDLLDTWDGTKPGMPIDDGHTNSLRDSFNSLNAFKDGIHDDVDDAVLGAGWLKCPLLVDGLKLTVFFRPVLQVILDMLKRGKDVRLWSGESGPAPPSNLRESPLDGDAFRENEAALMAEKKDATCFVLGLHVYSDASQLSWSGGKQSFLHDGCVAVSLAFGTHEILSVGRCTRQWFLLFMSARADSYVSHYPSFRSLALLSRFLCSTFLGAQPISSTHCASVLSMWSRGTRNGNQLRTSPL